MNEQNEALPYEPEVKDTVEIPVDDDRYPGSFFRIPGPPRVGNTSWSLS
jgi:hypothetical protein